MLSTPGWTIYIYIYIFMYFYVHTRMHIYILYIYIDISYKKDQNIYIYIHIHNKHYMYLSIYIYIYVSCYGSSPGFLDPPGIPSQHLPGALRALGRLAEPAPDQRREQAEVLFDL